MSKGNEKAENPLEIAPHIFERFARFITAELGIKMSEAKAPMLQSRLQRRLRELQMDSLQEYQDYLFKSEHAEEERIHFINAVTTNKTDFFREPQHFEFLVEQALPVLAQIYGKSSPWLMKLWCAGCSSGEEVYTQAMVLSEYAKQHTGFDFAMLATDISTKVLQHAETGIYEESRVASVPLELRKRYLRRSRDTARSLVRIVPDLRRKVSLHRLNFMDEDYGVKDKFEVIFFRNVMIYFDKPTQEKVINRLCRNLKPGGFLFVGHSESLAGLNIPVTVVASAVYRKPL